MCGVSTNNKPSLVGYGYDVRSAPDTYGNLQMATGGQIDANGNVVGGDKPPGDAPDLTDKLVRAQRAARAAMLLSGRGRSSTLGGPIAKPSALGKTMAGG